MNTLRNVLKIGCLLVGGAVGALAVRGMTK
jgi:hypothetical protein